MQVVGEVGNGRLAVAQAAALKPDVLLLDLSMPEMNGLETARTVVKEMPGVAIVALTRYGDEAYVQALLAAGARGFVLKQSASTELLNAIRVAASGRSYLDAAVTQRVAGAFVARHAGETPLRRASERELEVLRLIAIGYSNKEIAARLDLSVKTIEVHKANAMRKLDLRGRVDIVRFAILQNWLHDA